MKRILLSSLLILVSSVVCANNWIVHSHGYGPVHVGMSIKRAEELLKTPLVLEESPLEEGCSIATPKLGYNGVYFRIDEGKISHVGISTSKIPSDAGLRIGDLADSVKRHYGNSLEIWGHKYEENAFYFFAWKEFRKFGVKYEIGTNGKVKEIRGGNATIMRVEGPCS